MSRFYWHWFQTNWTHQLSPGYYSGMKIGTAFKYLFEETMPKLSVSFRNYNSQDSHKNQYPGPVLNFGFTEPQYSDKLWSNLLRKCHIFTIGNTHTQKILCLPVWSSDSCSSGFVWNQLPRVGIKTRTNDVITVQVYCHAWVKWITFVRWQNTLQIMTVVKSTASHFHCYEPLIEMITVQSLWYIIIRNRCMSQGLNQYPMVTTMHSVSE